jgi:hypothetical protein
MTEAQWTYKLTAALRKADPNAVVIKLADAYTAGIPDFFITIRGVTTFFEVKLTTNKEIFRPIQLQTLQRLGRGAYIVWDVAAKRGDLFWALNQDYTPYFNFKELVEQVLIICCGNHDPDGVSWCEK